jgi:6,7-dimethyl-8-ribityllumazine synthase
MKPILIVVAPYYTEITDMLMSGAKNAASAAGYTVEILEVPGAFEIPAAIACAATTGNYAGYIALGCVIRGETTHYDYVCGMSAHGLQQLAVEQKLSLGYGILTCETMEQAIVRADPTQGDKGGEATRAALRMIAIRNQYGVA